ncbi:PspC domain-containing protein [Enterocloster bolteae]|uniref:PspC domain-containing protein n=1 Tax=Enterocloster bolteae TaxID=208479 RepID=UPI003A3CDCB1
MSYRNSYQKEPFFSKDTTYITLPFFGINPLAFRLIFFFSGPGLLAYLILCAFVPEKPY